MTSVYDMREKFMELCRNDEEFYQEQTESLRDKNYVICSQACNLTKSELKQILAEYEAKRGGAERAVERNR